MSPGLAICLLGTFRVLKAGAPVAVRPGGKTEALLRELALQEHYRASRERLLETMWPESDTSHAVQALNSLVHATRKQFGDVLDGAAPVVYADGGYRLNTDAGVSVDIGQFDALSDRAERGFHSGDTASALEHALGAITVYQGDLCEADGVHALVERERLRALYLSLLGQVADQYFTAADYPAALRYALRLLRHDPCREDAHRLVMRCHVRSGRRAQAFRQYRTCEQMLQAEFGVRPELLTVALFDQVRTSPGSV
ncbi:bacterial transcriptional activator domain-containing protein [Amycolatopsis mongoliensis]|uniref:Bacterial transcriptional activator domain-containing protein n=1 Tax=Amycolatopsis mongoliensis TaxID=715475 RepID=A0A9Y2NC37_9PSEU|nr:bacterial transcriptional activator domain-containing protein [Amycolatopsis sp. 4-36]WIX99161.1 bacterial transcriptional activator domain-containing protein [Amycolatopsis sp. 4-36]